MSTHLLKVLGVSKRFGGLRAVDDISIEVCPTDIYGLIGPNGAGKSTLFNVLAGVVRPTSGSVLFKSKDVSNLPAFKKCRLGIGRTFQTAQSFTHHTVRDNLMAASFAPAKPLRSWVRLRATQDEHRRLAGLLERTGLSDRLDDLPADLNNLELQKLSIAMALVNQPELLLLDEPSGGLVEAEVAELAIFLKDIHAGGISIIIIDHKMSLIMGLCNVVTVMAAGKWIATGTPSEVLANPDVKQVYLGNG